MVLLLFGIVIGAAMWHFFGATILSKIDKDGDK